MKFYLVCLLCYLTADVTLGDISEHFLRDQYAQESEPIRVRTRQQRQDADEKVEEEGKMERRSSSVGPSEDDLYDDYYDYLAEIGASPQKSLMKKKEEEAIVRRTPDLLQKRRNAPRVADDVLGRVVRKKSKSPYSYRRPGLRDNIAMPSVTKRAHMVEKSDDPKNLPGLENVERLIPSSLKTIIEESGRRIVKAVLKPVNDLTNIPRSSTFVKEASFSSKMDSWMQPYRTYFGYMAPTFAPDHITSYLVAQWVSTIAITFSWIVVGYMYQTMGIGRSDDGGSGRASMEPWEYLVPDSETVATVMYDLSEAAQRWHDEL
jgi:hypothetical protein